MYSGTTLHHKSGNVVGVHQKIDRAAHKLLAGYQPEYFPSLKDILHFEGKNGPDGIKRKNPGEDEPWHFIDPQSPYEGDLIPQIKNHHDNLAQALEAKDGSRAAFEAAWLAHAIVDGLTPAHHFPLEDHLEEVRGEPKETRDSVRSKLVLPGESGMEKLRNNWQFWGAKGMMTSHLLFELGVASAITPLRIKNLSISDEELKTARLQGAESVFLQSLEAIATLHMYEDFIHKGWTPTLARQTKKELIPRIINTVTLAWLSASQQKD